MDDFIRFFDKNKRYFAAGVVGVCIVAVVAFGAGTNGGISFPSGIQSAVNKADNSKASLDKIEADSDIGKLISDYYKAYASNDIDALSKLASPISDYEKSYIKFVSEHVDKYEIAEIYGQTCEDGNILLSVYEKMHFKDIKSPAPGVDFFYIKKAEDGTYSIDNLYSKFNMQSKEQAMDPTVTKAIADYEQMDEVVALLSRVQSDYNDIDINDKDFNKFMTGTLQEASSKWAADYQKELKKKEKAEKKKAEEEKKKEEEKKQEEAEKAEEAKSGDEAVYLVTKDKVNMRTDASTDADLVYTVKKGKKVQKLSEKDGWTKVKFKDYKGYIRNDFLKEYEKKEEDSDSKSETETESKTDTKTETSSTEYVYTKDKVNMRKGASTDSDIVTQVKRGKKLKKLGEKNGWIKVKYKGKTGYIREDFISTKKLAKYIKGDKIKIKATINIRKKKSTSSKVVTKVYKGDEVTVVKYNSNWTKVKFKGKTGYIKSSLL